LKDGWRELKEPKSFKSLIVFSIPFIIINVLICQLIIEMFTQNYIISGTINSENILESFLICIKIFVLIPIVLIVVHELIHLIFIPNFIKSENTYIGLTTFGGYVYTKEAIKKYRLCLVYLAPFVFLSIILNAILGILGLYNAPLIAFIFFNSIGSSADMFGLTLVLLQVPKDACLLMNGIRTYWKRMDPSLTKA
jgi:hypothetical protein